MLEFAVSHEAGQEDGAVSAWRDRWAAAVYPPVAAGDTSALVLGCDDDVVFVCASAHFRDRRGRGGLVYVVVHRGHGVWTHVYRVVRDPRSARPMVCVERVIEGDRLSAACDWAWARFAA